MESMMDADEQFVEPDAALLRNEVVTAEKQLFVLDAAVTPSILLKLIRNNRVL